MFGIHQDGTYRVENIGYSVPTLTSGYIVATRSIQREADLTTTGELFGRWTDPETGRVHWDAVEVIENQSEAIIAAGIRGELAIWDVARGAAIDIDRDYMNQAIDTRTGVEDVCGQPASQFTVTVTGEHTAEDVANILTAALRTMVSIR